MKKVPLSALHEPIWAPTNIDTVLFVNLFLKSTLQKHFFLTWDMAPIKYRNTELIYFFWLSHD